MAHPSQPPKKEYEGEIQHQAQMPAGVEEDNSPESLAREKELLAELRDPTSELGSLFAETAATPRTSKD